MRSHRFVAWRSTFSHMIPKIDPRACAIVDLGRIDYAEAFELQRRLVAARKEEIVPNLLLICEHPHVLTLGRIGKMENLRATEVALADKNVQFHHTNRGGDITYHGPGQI